MRNVEIKLTLNKKDDGEYAVLFMGAEVISFSESVYKTDGDKIYEALVNMFAKGVEIGVRSERKGLSGVSIIEN
ncbi:MULTISPECIES: hypothetical protein [Aeromonas]|jgi:hypothetical protein|uniref:hypothetical protein n=1 Tax=Aeromonas TaxID=642 RepID=UPI0022E72A60|nr:hypothetical protein [Aeromonas sp. QDB66]MDD9305315.1 hypothetical protein [Aeromonas hydrophila]